MVRFHILNHTWWTFELLGKVNVHTIVFPPLQGAEMWEAETPHVRWTQDHEINPRQRKSPLHHHNENFWPLYSAGTISTRQSFSWNTKLGVQIEKRKYKPKGLRQEAERWRPVWVFLRLWSWNHPLIYSSLISKGHISAAISAHW